MNEKQIEELVGQVLNNLVASKKDNYISNTSSISTNSNNSQVIGIFENMEDAINEAEKAFFLFSKVTLKKRKEIIDNIKKRALENVDLLAKLAVEETKMGRVADKVQKNILAITKTPGVEDIVPSVHTGDYGMTLEERAPYGVIGSITPSTNPSETFICNSIGMIAAGNAVVYNPHPGAKRVSQKALEIINNAIVEVGGPHNLITTVNNPTLETGSILMKHPKIRLLVVTGGPQVVEAAFKAGKKVIAAGPGNPPVVVDETADIQKAAKDIILGATLDNNILCIAEKEIIVVKEVAKELLEELIKNGTYLLNETQIKQLEGLVLENNKVNRKFVGKDAKVILSHIGVEVSDDVRMITCVVDKTHLFVQEELLMPIVPTIIVENVDKAIDLAVEVEHGFHHTACMHSKNIDNLHKMASKVNTSIFVKNGPSCAGLGFLGEGYTTFTIASPTGEGITTAKTFTRHRRCVLKDYFRIV